MTGPAAGRAAAGSTGVARAADVAAGIEVTQRHLDGFAAISGDHNPIHVDPDYAATTDFRRTVAHGMFLFGLVHAEVRRRFPGVRMARQGLMFPAPTPAGTEVVVLLDEVPGDTGQSDRTGERMLSTRVVHADGTVGLRGTCTLSRTRHPDDGLAHPPRRTPATTRAGGQTSSWWSDAVGRSATLARAFTRADVAEYAALTSAECLDDDIPEPLIGGLFSTLLGMHLPGPGTNYLKQSMRFAAVGRVDEPLTATVTITRTVPDKRLCYLATTCVGEGRRVLATGEALVLARGVTPPD